MKPREDTKSRALRGMLLASLLILAGGLTASAFAAKITEDNVADRIAAATTSEDHQALASYFRERAAQAARNVEKHEAMLASYKKVSGKPYLQMKTHCQRLIESYRGAQKEFEALASEHEKLAEE